MPSFKLSVFFSLLSFALCLSGHHNRHVWYYIPSYLPLSMLPTSKHFTYDYSKPGSFSYGIIQNHPSSSAYRTFESSAAQVAGGTSSLFYEYDSGLPKTHHSRVVKSTSLVDQGSKVPSEKLELPDKEPVIKKAPQVMARDSHRKPKRIVSVKRPGCAPGYTLVAFGLCMPKTYNTAY